jgi:glycosidase
MTYKNKSAIFFLLFSILNAPIFGQKSVISKKTKKTNQTKTKTATVAKHSDKLIIYQITAHLWGNTNTTNKINGSEIENGCGKLEYINDAALAALKKTGYTHIWVMGLLESATLVDHSAIGIPNDHPAIVKGRAGSAFAVKDYYDINPNLAINPKNRMAEFEALRDRIHKHGMKLIMDFIPNHVARVYHSDVKPGLDFGKNDNNSVIFDPQNNFYYLPGTEFIVPDGVVPAIPQNSFYEEKPAKVTGNDVFKAEPSINDWFETVKLNYGVNLLNNRSKHFTPTPNTWDKMTDILKYWTEKGVDGFRCDMAEMVPVEFWAYSIPKVKALNPEIKFIAEIYNPAEYKNYVKTGGFDYLYDKVGLYDALRRLIENKPEANVADITKVWQQESGDISEHMLRFLENHDEQRIASDFFGKDAEKAIPAMVLSATLHTGPLMVFFSQEFGEPAMDAEGFGSRDGRTTMFDFWGVKSHQAWANNGKFDGASLNEKQKSLQQFYQNLIQFTKKNPAIEFGKFYDLQYANNYPNADKKKIYSYLRYVDGQKLLFVYNFDQEKSFETTVFLPAEALKAAGIDDTKPMKLTEIFLNKSVKPKIEKGNISLKLEANSVYVFEVK